MINNYAKFQLHAFAGLFANIEALYCIFVKNSWARTACVLPTFCKHDERKYAKIYSTQLVIEISQWFKPGTEFELINESFRSRLMVIGTINENAFWQIAIEDLEQSLQIPIFYWIYLQRVMLNLSLRRRHWDLTVLLEMIISPIMKK